MLTVHSLTLDHVAGVDHAHLDLPPSGVVVVHGPNEMGKTTLLTAFRLLLSEVPVSSKAKRVRDLKSASQDVASTISAELTVGDHRLTVTKSFNKGSGGCELVVTSPRRENLTGRQAAERFSSLLSTEVDTGLLKALTIDQGESLDILAAAGIRSLEQALGDDDAVSGTADGADTADGAGAGSGDDQGAAALIGAVAEENARYYTKTGQPARELRTARAALAEAIDAEDGARQRYDRAQGIIADLERLRGEKDDIARQEPGAVRAAGDAAESLAAGRRAAEELDRHRSALTAARERLQVADQRRDARADQIRALADADAEVEELTATVERAVTAAEEEQARSEGLRTRLTATRRESWVARAWSTWLAARQRHREHAGTLADLTGRCDRAAEISAAVDDRDRALRADPATPQALEDLRRSAERLAQAVTVRNTASTTVHVSGPVDGRATVDGVPLDLDGSGEDGAGSATVHATARRDLQLGDYTVTVIPARDVHEADDDVDRATADHNRRLTALGAADVSAAEDLGRRRSVLEEELRELRLSLAQVTGDRTVAELAAARDRAAAEVGVAAQDMTEALDRLREEDPDDEVGVDGIPVGAVTDPESVSATADDLRSLSDAAARRAESLQEELDTATRAGAVVRLEGRRRELARSVSVRDRLSAALQAAREETPDSDLDRVVDERRAAVQDAEEACTAAEEKAGDVDVDDLAALADAAAVRVRRLRERAVATGNALSEASGKLSQHGGVAEDLAETRTTRQRAEREARRVERQAAAAHLLHTTVQQALTAARERYEAPFRGTFEKLARTLYGAPVDFEFDADLTVARRSFQGVSLDTAQLSGGAREQLSVLTRLAVADLVGGGDAVPVFIDDALGFSDRGRIGRMNLVLDALGRDHQIIVLTCDVARFEGIAGAEFVPMEQVRAGA
ncbi:ATP-binding protein [Corynebacterium nuruki]|nr:ATP-binding protein [Corynebacterium nuruki]